MTNHRNDLSSVPWSGLLEGLTPRQRDAVETTLRSSAEAGWPVDAHAVRLLVAYANGDISARDYATGILSSIVAGPIDEVPPPADDSPLVPVSPIPPSVPRAVLIGDEAVSAYLAGEITVEEFLRITRGASA